MSTTPEPSQNPPQGGFPPPPPPPGTGTGTGGSYSGSPTGYPPPDQAPGGYPPGGYPPGGPASGYPPPGQPSPSPAYTQAGHPPPGYGPPAPLTPSDQRLWAVLAHLGNLFVWIIAPLVVWLVFRGRGAFLEDHAKESLNFQITVGLAAIVLSIATVVTFGLGALLFIPVGIAWLVFLIIAAVKASQGEPYRYPLTYRFIK